MFHDVHKKSTHNSQQPVVNIPQTEEPNENYLIP